MAKQMTPKETAAWQNKVVDYTRRMIEKFDINEAAARVWRFYGCPTEIKNGKVIIWFGRNSVAI